MGFSITWFAIPEAHAELFFQKLGLVATGETLDVPDSLISHAKMDTGWRVLWYDKHTCPFLDDETIAQYSRTHDIIVCTVEEHCMNSSATLWRDGRSQWHLHHDGSDGSKSLNTDGQLPECFSSIRTKFEQLQIEARRNQEGVDYLFEIPLKVAESIVGFKHDEDTPHVVDGLFHVLTRTTAIPSAPIPQKEGFLSRLFGR